MKDLDKIKIDQEGNVLKPINEMDLDMGTQSFSMYCEMYDQAQTITERLKSDKEKIENLREGVKTNSLLLDRNIELSEDITQLKAKAKRDFDTFNQNESTYLDRIIQVEKNSVSTEYLEETVFNYKKQIIKLKQETQKLKEVLSNINKPKCEKCNCIITDNQSIESGLCDSCLLKD